MGVARSISVEDRWSEDELRCGLLARDTRALEALIARYAREGAYFVRILLDRVGTPQDVEECVNDLFVTAWVDIAAFDPARGSLRTWLTMRAKFLALDRRRQIQRRQAMASYAPDESSEYAEEWDGPASAGALSGRESLEGLLERREQHEQLRWALDMLPELDKALVYMRYFRLASTEEIAAKTGLTRRAIDTRLWRARKGLRDMLEALEERAYGQVRPH